MKDLRHHLAHLWPRVARPFVPDLWLSMPVEDLPGVEQTAALTFDDGPTESGTSRLLDTLARWSVPATFFLLGENVRREPGRAREIQSAGHAIGNHFRSHIDCWKTPRRAVVREVTEGGRILEDILGETPRWCRPPYGRLTHTLVKWARLHRQKIVLWDVFPPDYRLESSPAFLGNVLSRRLRNRSIVCLHDNAMSFDRTPQMLTEMLPRLRDAGWRFVTLPSPTTFGR